MILGSVIANFILLMLFSHLNLYVVNFAVAQSSPSSAEVVVIGFLFVLLVLSALGIVTALLGRIFQAVDRKDKAPGGLQTIEQAVPVVSSASYELPRDVQAVIVAAVHTVLEERPHRIVRVKEVR